MLSQILTLGQTHEFFSDSGIIQKKRNMQIFHKNYDWNKNSKQLNNLI